MEQYYKRVEDIDDKVKDARLPYPEWKVLFLVGEKSNAEEISSLIGDDSSAVSDIFESLVSKGLITKIGTENDTEETETVSEEPSATSIGDALLLEEESENELLMEPEPEEEELETAEVEQEGEPSIKEDKIQVNTDFLTDDLLPKEEYPGRKSEKEKVPEEEKEEVSETDESEFDLNLEAGLEEEIAQTEEIQLKEESAKEPETTTETSEDQETISDVSKKTIMVIDDSIVIRKMIEIALEDEDFNIVTAISGKEGLENIKSQQPNLVILDMMLPDMNGIDVLKTIKSDKKLPVIMLSGKDSPQLIESAKEIGVDDFLPKPFRDEELVEKVRTLVGV